MNFDYSIRLPFEVTQIYGTSFAVNKGVVVNPPDLQVFIPKLNDSELKSVDYQNFPTLEISGSGSVYLRIKHSSKEDFLSNELVPITGATIVFDDDSESETETPMKIAEIEYNSENNFASINQVLRSDVYPLIFGTGSETPAPV